MASDNDFSWKPIACDHGDYGLADYSPGCIIRCENLYSLLYRSRVDAINVLYSWNPHYVEYCKKHPAAEAHGTAAATVAAAAATLVAAAALAATAVAAAAPVVAATAATAAADIAAQTAPMTYTLGSASIGLMAAHEATSSAEALVGPDRSLEKPAHAQPLVTMAIKAETCKPSPSFKEVSEESALDLLSQEEDLKAGNEVKWVEKLEPMTVIGACYDTKTCLPLIKVLVCACGDRDHGPIVGWICLHPAMSMHRAALVARP